MVERWKSSLSRSKVNLQSFVFLIYNLVFSRTVILTEGNKYRLKLKSVGLTDAGEISFQCGDLKDSCKLTVKECM
jgi:hypothetical protein